MFRHNQSKWISERCSIFTNEHRIQNLSGRSNSIACMLLASCLGNNVCSLLMNLAARFAGCECRWSCNMISNPFTVLFLFTWMLPRVRSEIRPFCMHPGECEVATAPGLIFSPQSTERFGFCFLSVFSLLIRFRGRDRGATGGFFKEGPATLKNPLNWFTWNSPVPQRLSSAIHAKSKSS